MKFNFFKRNPYEGLAKELMGEKPERKMPGTGTWLVSIAVALIILFIVLYFVTGYAGFLLLAGSVGLIAIVGYIIFVYLMICAFAWLMTAFLAAFLGGKPPEYWRVVLSPILRKH